MLEIRRLGPGDEALAGQIIRDVKRGMPDDARAARYLANEMNVLLVAMDHQQPVGFIIAYELERADNRSNMMFFYEIEVAESHRRKRVGTALIDNLKSICRKRNIGKMFVLTDRDNSAARSLYRHSGGEEEYDDGVLFVYD